MPSKEEIELLRELPPVDEILAEKEILSLLETNSRNIVVAVIRQTLELIRKGILQGKIKNIYKNKLIQDVMEGVIDHSRWNLRHVINGTGVVLHTNLGRALLSDRAKKAVAEISQGYCNLEMNLKTGKRGSRYSAVESLLCQLTGAEAALVVNNNAAAVLLALSTLAKGKEVIVSRGQLVEIGGSFRIPEVMAQSGGKLIEVGATNKTYSRDYEKAVNEETALLLHVHMSNYRIVGFTEETSVEELVQLGRKYHLPVMSDLGSGFLVDLSEYGLPKEPTVQETVAAGADVVTFSGDKLLGGPQAGILVGKKEFIEEMKLNPLNRALRIDKFTVSALEATLRDYFDFNNCLQTIPTLRMITESISSLQSRGKELATILQAVLQSLAQVTVEDGYSQVGGGAMPTAILPSIVLTIRPDKISVESLVKRLRASNPPVVGRVQNEALVLDMRTLQENDTEPLLQSIRKAMQS